MLRAMLWPFAFAVSAFRSWRGARLRRFREEERVVAQAIAEGLAAGVRSPPLIHYPFSIYGQPACTLPGNDASLCFDEVTCPECRAVICTLGDVS